MINFAKFAALVLLGVASVTHAWDDRRASIPVIVNERTIPFYEFAIYVMPNSPIQVAFVDATDGGSVTFMGQTLDLADAELKAPAQPGLERLVIRNLSSNEETIINVFTLTPATLVDKEQKLNGYRIGRYPSTPRNGQDIYLPPKGFVEITQENKDVKVSPNFTLGQFVAKQASGYPKYVVLRSNLLLKLENILATLNRAGHPVSGFTIMSGYRTPFYNRAIGNVQYSRHVWGGAADFFIDDSPKDGRMDDLNKDGKVDRADARWLSQFIESMSQRGEFGRRIGGIGVYGSNSAHGPFVHVDVRGSRARW